MCRGIGNELILSQDETWVIKIQSPSLRASP
jgi:hypothetical protein